MSISGVGTIALLKTLVCVYVCTILLKLTLPGSILNFKSKYKHFKNYTNANIKKKINLHNSLIKNNNNNNGRQLFFFLNFRCCDF